MPTSHRSPIALSLAGFYTAWTILPVTLLLWFAQAGLFSSSAMGQTAVDSSVPPSQRVLEDARRRLIERGEFPGQEEFEQPFIPNGQEFEAYRLGPGDSIFVNVLRFADLSFQGTLDLQGNVIVPLVGALPLEGLTVEQAREQIRVALDRFVIDPQVDVILIAQRPVQVTILGEVVRPGLYPLQAPQLSTALVSAGGTTGLADLRTVRIRRSFANGETLEQEFDLFSPLRDAATVPDIQLTDGDIIVVPTLTEADRQDYDRALIARSTLAQQQINIRVVNYAGTRGGVIGNLTLPNGSSFVDALTTISPSLDSADLRKIALIRFDVEQGRAVTQEINGRNALRGDFSQDPMLEHNDVIIVGRNLIARITYALNTFTQPFRDVLGFLLFFDSLATSADNLFRPGGSSDD
ncbi:polysaccharide biosynthesis/export family protein [Egbenema bharatensis]|uniref:polysaccharide biosynthesis/export family protein n=1 Tax=Egbenema bharatensis TaxID=3463334 RepID=UPI003A890F81